MRYLGAFLLAAVAACYQPPGGAASCAIACTSDCPDGLSCVNGMCVAPGEVCVPTFRSVHAGNGFACALDDRGSLWCWGSNQHHQIDPGDKIQYERPTRRAGTTVWDAIATSGGHVCGLAGGQLSCWGQNDRQQVTGTVAGDVADPEPIVAPNSEDWTAVATGYDETCGIAGGTLYCWGANTNGQLGDGTTVDHGLPLPVQSSVTDWIAVSPGPDHTCAISATAGLHCWGRDDYGQLGDNITSGTPTLVPTQIAAAPASLSAVAVGQYSTCGIAAGQLYCWGRAGGGSLGDPASIDPGAGDRWVPTLASGLDGWTELASAQELACALRGDEVWCWGTSRGGGGLGNGIWARSGWGLIETGASDLGVGWNTNLDRTTADVSAALSDAGNLDLGCVVLDGGIACWGDNRFGQLGQGAATMQPEPVEVLGDHRFTSLVAGDAHVCGIDDAGALYCWGSTEQGQANGTASGTAAAPCGSMPGVACDLAVPTQVAFAPTATSVALGVAHTCALDGDAVTCWGNDDNDQLGDAGLLAPTQVPGSWTALYQTGGYGQCAVTGGQTQCWGMVTQPHTTPTAEPDLDGAASISSCGLAGTDRAFGCILDANHQLACYGTNDRGQFGNGQATGTLCGNGACDDGETCGTCPGDCGNCPLSKLGRTYQALAVSWAYQTYSHTYYGGFACGIRTDGQIECWGRSGSGQTTADPTVHYRYDPVLVPGLADCTEVTASDAHACALCGGQISCWGDDTHGGVGAGAPTVTPITVPRTITTPLEAGDSWAQLASGVGFTCARTTQGHAYCWGFSAHGALGNGAASANLPTPVGFGP